MNEDYYIDTHFHILPGVDDGAKDLTMALAMARLALADGVRLIVATPHPNPTSGIGSQAITTQAVEELQQALQQDGLNELQIVPGVECMLVPEILTLLQQGQLFGLNNSRYVLIELDRLVVPVNIEQVMFKIRSAGYVPIIAHPERYNYVQQDLGWLARLVRLGCLSQVTAGAFYGRFGQRCQKAANALTRHNLAHLVASDTHNLKLRAPGIAPARPLIEELVGPVKFRQMSLEVPRLIIFNGLYEAEPPESIKQRPFWKFW